MFGIPEVAQFSQMYDELEGLLVKRDVRGDARKWRVGKSKCGGRGVFATSKIEPGELIFVDFPVLYGPKTNNDLIGCLACSKNNKPLRGCSKNCRLPVCSEKCENRESHKNECNLLRSLNVEGEDWSPIFYRSLTLIRALFMTEDDKQIVKLLHANRGKQVDTQISELQNLLKNKLSDSEIDWVRHCCGVLDGTAFEIELDTTANSLKGLYPLSAMMNHNCVPNTRLSYTNESNGYRMLVIASTFISEGSEILTSYCPLLWGTNLRRTFLLYTKHFQCACERCRDRTEFGTNLQALLCTCEQHLLPIEPLKFDSDWKCDSCGGVMHAREIMSIQKNLKHNPNLQPHFPECNYIQVQGKMESVFKATKNGTTGLSDCELREVIKKCISILKLIEKLHLGNTQLKGRLSDQLEAISRELRQRGILYNRTEIEKYSESGKSITLENEKARGKLSDKKITQVMENVVETQKDINGQ